MQDTPQFVLFSGIREQADVHDRPGGCWYFRIQTTSGHHHLEASDIEPGVSLERLELLAVVRGLEALEQPSRVTVVTTSKHVSRAIRIGLDYWRQRDWKWERFGEKVPMKNGDLWKRIDAALHIHEVQCRTYRVDAARPRVPAPMSRQARRTPHHNVKATKHPAFGYRSPLRWIAGRTANLMHTVADSIQKPFSDSSPRPHVTA